MNDNDKSLIKADYFRENLDCDRTERFTLRQLSVRHNVSYKTIRNISSSQKWNAELRRLQLERSKKAISEIQSDEAFKESEIRFRQASLSRKLVDKGMEKLELISPDSLTTKEAIEMVKLGLCEERKALGLADKYEVLQSAEEKGLPSVVERMHQHRRVELLTIKLMEYVESKAPTEQNNDN